MRHVQVQLMLIWCANTCTCFFLLTKEASRGHWQCPRNLQSRSGSSPFLHAKEKTLWSNNGVVWIWKHPSVWKKDNQTEMMISCTCGGQWWSCVIWYKIIRCWIWFDAMLVCSTQNVLFLADAAKTQIQSGKPPVRYGDIYQSATRTPSSTEDEVWLHIFGCNKFSSEVCGVQLHH